MAEIIDKTEQDSNIVYNVSVGATDSITLATQDTYVDKNIVFNIKTGKCYINLEALDLTQSTITTIVENQHDLLTVSTTDSDNLLEIISSDNEFGDEELPSIEDLYNAYRTSMPYVKADGRILNPTNIELVDNKDIYITFDLNVVSETTNPITYSNQDATLVFAGDANGKLTSITLYNDMYVGTTIKRLEDINIDNLMENPLYGKTIVTFGDSISYGVGYVGGYGKTIADKYGATLINKSVDGATLANGVADTVKGGYRACISDAIKEYTGYANVDYIILEGGINDAWAGEDACALGRLSTTNADFNITTLLGGLESAIMFLQKNWSDKNIIFVFPHAGMLALTHFWHVKAKPAIKRALIKWNVPHVDIQYSTPLMGPYGIDSGLKTKYLSDNTHPNQKGYETFYTDQIYDLMIRRNATGPCPVVAEESDSSSSSQTEATINNITNEQIDLLFD